MHLSRGLTHTIPVAMVWELHTIAGAAPGERREEMNQGHCLTWASRLLWNFVLFCVEVPTFLTSTLWGCHWKETAWMCSRFGLNMCQNGASVSCICVCLTLGLIRIVTCKIFSVFPSPYFMGYIIFIHFAAGYKECNFFFLFPSLLWRLLEGECY